MKKEAFQTLLTEEAKSYKNLLETGDNQWIVKGFIDVHKHIYSITNDTKVVSKIIELLLIPKLEQFVQNHGLTLELPSKQNFYPDLTFCDPSDGSMFAVDIKSSYYDKGVVNGLTLGSYWGYFRNRDKVKNMDRPYGSYTGHYVLGVLYRQKVTDVATQKCQFLIDELQDIPSVLTDFIIFVQPKWKIAGELPGSGNTRNIGGIRDIEDLTFGRGPFTRFADGEKVFDAYWTQFYNKTDAKSAGIGQPKYHNIETFKKYLASQQIILTLLQNE